MFITLFMRVPAFMLIPLLLLAGCGGGGDSSSAGAATGAAVPPPTVRMQATLGPLVGSTLAEAGTFDFDVPAEVLARDADDEAYWIVICDGTDVDPNDDGVRVEAEETDFLGVIRAIALRSDLLALGSDTFRINALTEVAFHAVASRVPDDVKLTLDFVVAQLDQVARA